MNNRNIIQKEVAPRDGFQFEKKFVSPEDRVAFIDELYKAGCRYIEIGSMVREDKVPQMAGSDIVALEIKKRVLKKQYPDATFAILTLNSKGAEKALDIITPDVSSHFEIAVVVAASDKFCHDNMGVDDMEAALQKLADPVIALAKERGVKVRGYVSTIFEGQHGEPIAPDRVAQATKRLLDTGCYEVSLGDTTGAGTPKKVNRLVKALENNGVTLDKVAGHFHDTNGYAIENVRAAYKLGITTFDSSAGGIGGCPFAHSPKGNLATEALIAYANANNIKTGLVLKKMVHAAHFGLSKIDKKSTSPVFIAMAQFLNLSKIGETSVGLRTKS